MGRALAPAFLVVLHAALPRCPAAPALPEVPRSVIIPDDARMGVRVLGAAHHDLQAVAVAPTRGSISRGVDPSRVPHTFGPVYRRHALFPPSIAALRKPYILRDHRGVVVTLTPFQYDPVGGVLRVYTEVVLEVTPAGAGRVNVPRPPRERSLSRTFHELYASQFVNYDPGAIKEFIRSVYESSDLAFLLLVGDSDHVATPYAALGNTNMLPFILSLACNTGEFAGRTCFAEAWLRATSDGLPIGAVGMYAASGGQYWEPPMAAQDETVDLFTAQGFTRLGALCFAGACRMMDEYPEEYPVGGGADLFDMWILFGDPSLRVVDRSGIQVSPHLGFSVDMPAGAPLERCSRDYTLTNHDETPIGFSVTCGAPWICVQDGAGTIPPGGEARVTVSVNSHAAALRAGSYRADVEFLDTIRTVHLFVGPRASAYRFDLDGSKWYWIWQNPGPQLPVTDGAWTDQVFDISSLADGRPSVYVRWGYLVAEGAYPFSGWNIDDVEIRAIRDRKLDRRPGAR